MNVERLNKVADVIEANPEHFDMAWWMAERTGTSPCVITGTREVESIVEANLFACGTTACLAGWVVFLWGAEVNPAETVSQNARRILGLSWATGADVFDADNKDCATADKAAAHLRRMASDYERAS